MTHDFLRAGPGAILFLLVAVALAGTVRTATAADPSIAAIEIRGNFRTPTSDVMSILGLKVGDPYSPRAVTEGVRRDRKSVV